MDDARRFDVEETPRIPRDGLLLGFAAMMPFPAALIVVLAFPAGFGEAALSLVTIWGAAVLLFLAGVRRGISFRSPGGPSAAQLLAMTALFLAGLAALLLPVGWALALQTVAYAGLMLGDPVAARRAEVPLYFARLRPPQMAIAVASLAALWAVTVTW